MPHIRAAMSIAFQLLLIVHVLAAMLWFGGAVFAPRRLREALELAPAAGEPLLASWARQSRIFAACATLVVLTGVAMVPVRFGGFGALPVRFHVALTLSLVWWLVGTLLTRRNGLLAIEAMRGGGGADKARAFARRVGMFGGIEHLLFTVNAVLMLWRL
ncbi:MAG: hypothetical protein OEZ06_23985 [Myxococcales bacterium]|nr:hypothetical protein [Myxococcales bacterium]